MSLDTLQRWFQSVIVEPAETPDGAVEAANAQVGWTCPAEEIILPNDRLTSVERLMIYRDQYLLRMDEALADDFPVVQQMVGESAFFGLVEDYVKHYPSRSYTLNHLGRNFPTFLREQKKSKLLVEVSEVEWELCEVYNEEEVPSLSAELLASTPPERWSEARFTFIPALRLLELRYPIYSLLNANRDEQELPKVRARPSWLLIWRHNFTLWRLELTRPQFELLDNLRQGMILADAMGDVLSRRRVRPERLFQRFASWLQDGLFRDVRFD